MLDTCENLYRPADHIGPYPGEIRYRGGRKSILNVVVSYYQQLIRTAQIDAFPLVSYRQPAVFEACPAFNLVKSAEACDSAPGRFGEPPADFIVVVYHKITLPALVCEYLGLCSDISLHRTMTVQMIRRNVEYS